MTAIRPGLYFLSFVEPNGAATSTALVLDFTAQACTWVRGWLPTRADAGKPLHARMVDREELTGVEVQIVAGAIDAPFGNTTTRHGVTEDLVGLRIEYTYSDTERYEHIYLNDRFYTWHCLDGSERGLADTDRCHYLKLAAELYLFIWREKIVPTLGIVIVDLRQSKTTGRIFGYQGFDFGTVTSFPVGAHLRRLGAGGE